MLPLFFRLESDFASPRTIALPNQVHVKNIVATRFVPEQSSSDVCRVRGSPTTCSPSSYAKFLYSHPLSSIHHHLHHRFINYLTLSQYPHLNSESVRTSAKECSVDIGFFTVLPSIRLFHLLQARRT